MENQILDQNQYSELCSDLQTLISSTKEQIEKFAKNQMVIAYWQMGKRISQENLNQNANYSGLIFTNLEKDLGIAKNTISRSVQFFKTYPANPPEESTLSWSHYRYLITINDEGLRLKLEEKAKDEGWSAAKLGQQIKNVKTDSGTSELVRPNKANYLYRAKIADVVDGDTLILEIDLGFDVFKKQRIRLAGIDAPEMKTIEGQKSFEYLRDLAASISEVVVRTNKVDIYGRFIGDVFYLEYEDKGTDKIEIFEKGVYLNEKIVQNGMAVVL